MKKISWRLKLPKTAQNALALLLICLTATILTSCKDKKFPTKKIWETDTVNAVCVEYEITDAKAMKYVFKEYHPIEKCDGVFGFSAEDTPKVMDWISDLITEVKAELQRLSVGV